MWEASKSQSYEKAVQIRDNISAIESIFEKQSVITSKNTNLNLDVLMLNQIMLKHGLM